MTSFRPSLKLLGLGLGLMAVLLLIGCSPDHPQSTFDAAGPVAEKQLTLFYIIFWAAVFVFVIVEGALLFAVVRYARRRGRVEMPKQVHGHTAMEISWTIFPAIVLAVIAVPTIIYIFDIAEDPGPAALEINVTGHQWWWEFEYPDQNLITANEMHVPVNRDVKLNLLSDDVIHSFWIPKLAGKQDVIPRNVNPMRFKSLETGIFFGQCAEFCGVAHAHMRFRVIVEQQDEFDGWVARYHELAGRTTQPDDRAAEGAIRFIQKGCLLCHTTTGPASIEVRIGLREAFERGELRFPAPNLTNFGSRTTMAAGMIEMNRENVVKWLHDPEEVKEGNRMGRLASVYVTPDAALTDEDIELLADYLLSLK